MNMQSRQQGGIEMIEATFVIALIFVGIGIIDTTNTFNPLGSALLLFIIAMGVTYPTEADTLDINLTSWHSNKDFAYNENNFGVGYTKVYNDLISFKIGAFKNSYGLASSYFLVSFQHHEKYFDFGFDVGDVTGYDNIESVGALENKDKFLFVILPNVTWKITKLHALTLGFMPSFGNKNSFLTLQGRLTL